jgi:predicted Zn-dependent protease
MEKEHSSVPVRTEAELGEWFHERMIAEYGNESETWATERIARISRRLNEVRRSCPVRGACPHDLHTEILWIGLMNAFTLPGNYLYITRELLQQGDRDEPFAFVLAHEMAHHDLGHTRLLYGPLTRMRHASALIIGSVLKRVGRQLLGPENELAADSYALDLCIAAGYDGRRCLELFTIMEAYSVDHRDLDGVFGTDESLSASENSETSEIQQWLKGVRGWTWRHLRGYPSLRERRAAVQAQLEDYALWSSRNSAD